MATVFNIIMAVMVDIATAVLVLKLATDAIARSASAFAGLNPRGRMSRREPLGIRCSAGGFPFQKKRFPGYSMFTGSISSEIRRFGGEARGRSTA